jgi:hypothetical protein
VTFRADGNSILRSMDDGEDVGVALAFSPNWAGRIADALNEATGTRGLRLREDPLSGDRVERLNVADRTPLRDVIAEGRHVVITGPYATAEMDTPGGRQIRSLSEGAVLPLDATAGAARHLIDVGLAKIVEAPTAAQAFEGAPTERHRLEAAALQQPPTVGHPVAGTVAYDYEQDPDAAARQVYGSPARPAQQVVTGAGEATVGDDSRERSAVDRGPADPGASPPKAGDSKDVWYEYRLAELQREGLSEQDARARLEGKNKADLVAAK